MVLLIGVVGLLGWRYYQGPAYVGIDEFGAYWHTSNNWQRLQFVRANGIQLIATPTSTPLPKKESKKELKNEPGKELKKRLKEGCLTHFLWPTYRVIYRDSVSDETYRLLRSYAAQKMMLRQSEEVKKTLY